MRYMTSGEVADLLNISTATLRRWRKAGVGPAALTVGMVIRYHRDVVDAWIQSHQHPAPTPMRKNEAPHGHPRIVAPAR